MTERQCDGCTLCCKLLPVVPLNKVAGQHCLHQRWGCAVHHKEGMPIECGLWNCRWLINDDCDDLARPDRSHYVIDIVPDYVKATRPGEEIVLPVVQIWCDPHYPEAHRDPELRKWLFRRGAEGWAALVRLSSYEAILLIPPQMSTTGRFEEKELETADRESGHSAEDIAAKLSQAGIYP